MFFILSKTFSYFIYPLTWIIVLLLWGYFAKLEKRRKRLFTAAVILFLIFSNQWLLDVFARAWDPSPVQIETGKKHSCAILLGGFTGEDANGRGHFTEASDRFIQAVELYKEGKVAYILVSGGNGSLLRRDGFKEGEWVKGQLLEMGVPADSILTENNSRNTLENAAFSKKVLDSVGLRPPYVLVTSAFHLPRAAWTFKKEGMDVVSFPANYMAGRAKFNMMDILPQAQPMDSWSFYIKEMIGFFIYKIKAR